MSHPAFAVHALELGPMQNFVYLIEDKASQHCAVVDPAWDVPAIITQAEKHGMKISDILLTHSHDDHINGIESLLEHSDAEVHLLKSEYHFWQHTLEKPHLHHGGDRLSLGKTSIEILHTPGHTPGSACYRLGNEIITGDTLFVFGCGRCDLRGGNPEDMYKTLKDMKAQLPQDMLIHPGHDYAVKKTCLLKEQIEGNPFMHYDTADAFIDYRLHSHDRTRDEPYAPVSKQQLKIANLL